MGPPTTYDRGKISVKGLGLWNTYFVEDKVNSPTSSNRRTLSGSYCIPISSQNRSVHPPPNINNVNDNVVIKI